MRATATSPANSFGGYSGNQAALRRCSRTSSNAQYKLEIGAVNDPLEAEADRVAEQVMRMPDPAVSSLSPSSPVLRRKCTACEEDKVPRIQMKQAGTRTNADFSPVVAQGTSGHGRPLDGNTRMFMESRFGRDFGNVRIYADETSARSAQTVDAAAYTVGDRIVFGAGRYAPHTTEGRKLLAHELTHSVQQGAAGSPRRVARTVASPKVPISDGAAPSIQRVMVGECTKYDYKTCKGQPCVPNVGKGTGFCRWSGTIKNGCICIAIDNTMLLELVEKVILAALIAAGIVIALDALVAAVACFVSGVCELAALIGLVGFAAAMIIVKLVGSSGSGAGSSASAATEPGTDSGAGGQDGVAPDEPSAPQPA
jgi:hypothetical protein